MESLDLIAGGVEDRSARGIARHVAGLIATGALSSRQRMPTTRVIADALGVSAGAISDAWQLLVTDGLLETKGRRGTFVTDTEAPAPWRRFRGVVGADLAMDLSTGFPDPELLIDIRPYLRRLADGDRYPGYPTIELDPLLADALARHLPMAPRPDNTFLATHVLGAMTELLPVLGGPYTRVAVADPEFAPYLDLLERFRMEPVALPMDEDGMCLADLERAVADGVKAVILQPRVHNPTGVVTSRARLEVIAELCARNDVWILDGDFYGELLPTGPRSAAEWAPDHTVFMRSFSKEIHPDIRVAVVVGAPRLIGNVQRRRVGGFDVSRVNQDLLRLLLDDGDRRAHTGRVREEYRRRTTEFVETLREFDVDVRPSDGFNVWVPVRSETDALIFLASHGIGVAPGSAFQIGRRAPHLRVSPIAITGDVRAVARTVAAAAAAGRRRV